MFIYGMTWMNLLALTLMRSLWLNLIYIDSLKHKQLSTEMSITYTDIITQWQPMRLYFREIMDKKDLLFWRDHFMQEVKNMQPFGVETAEVIGNISIWVFLFCFRNLSVEFHLLALMFQGSLVIQMMSWQLDGTNLALYCHFSELMLIMIQREGNHGHFKKVLSIQLRSL